MRSFKRYETKQRRQSWTCTACGHHIHPTAGTIFHKSSTSLHLWFYAIYLVSSSRCGIAAKQLEREIGVNYKTALRMLHLIRQELMEQDYTGPLTGEVEADETFIGGKMRESDRRRLREEVVQFPARTGRSAPSSSARSSARAGPRDRRQASRRGVPAPSSRSCCPARWSSPTTGRATTR